ASIYSISSSTRAGSGCRRLPAGEESPEARRPSRYSVIADRRERNARAHRSGQTGRTGPGACTLNVNDPIAVADPPPRDAMSHHARRMIVAIVGMLVLVLAVTRFFVHINQFRPLIEEEAAAALGRGVTLGNLRLSWSNRSLTADTLTVADDPQFSHAPFLSAKSVSMSVELLPLLLARSLKVTSITIDSPDITVIRNAAGRWNYSSLGSSSLIAGTMALGKLAWTNGQVVVGSTHLKKRTRERNTTGSS